RGPPALPEKHCRVHNTLPVPASRQWRFQWCSPASDLPLRSVMYSPLRGSAGLASLTAAGTKTRLPQTTGDDQPARGIAVFERTLRLSSHSPGSVLPCPTRAAGPPRKAGQLSARAGGTSSRSATNARVRMGDLVGDWSGQAGLSIPFALLARWHEGQ